MMVDDYAGASWNMATAPMCLHASHGYRQEEECSIEKGIGNIDEGEEEGR
jgi:hypothetical protein